MAEVYWSWVEKLFKRIPFLDYCSVSVLAGIITLFILLYFSLIYNSFSIYNSEGIDFYRAVTIVSISILITIEPSGIVYFLSRIRQTSEMLKFGIIEHEKSSAILQDLNERFTKNRLYNILAMLVVAPCIATVVVSYLMGDTFWHWEGTISSLLFSIIYYALEFFICLMLATIIWILINISYFYRILSRENILKGMNFNVFYGFQVGFLYNSRDLLVKFSIYYFICVFFAILLYVSPAERISYQMLLYIFIDILGILIFISGWTSLQKIFKRKWNEKVIEIDNLYDSKFHESIIYIAKDMNDEKKLQRLSTEIDLLQKQREKLAQIIKSERNSLDMIQVSISIMATILAFGQKLFDIFGLRA